MLPSRLPTVGCLMCLGRIACWYRGSVSQVVECDRRGPVGNYSLHQFFKLRSMPPAFPQSSEAQRNQDSHCEHLCIAFCFFSGEVDECADSGILLMDEIPSQ